MALSVLNLLAALSKRFFIDGTVLSLLLATGFLTLLPVAQLFQDFSNQSNPSIVQGLSFLAGELAASFLKHEIQSASDSEGA